ncbi:MAG TPA: hypothetical protein EYG33_01720, partial [Candidatus Poseidoniales archaeon]|nr:hypothetical protein [Candidatus Poseidoniales archaeon]
WWYGLDQDSGYDENWDVLFKVHLSNVYRAIGLELPPYLQDLWTNPAIPDPTYSGTLTPMIDGLALAGEWDGSAKYDASDSDGQPFDINSFRIGYDSNNVYVQVNTSDFSIDGKALEIYFMQPNAVNFNEAETNFRTLVGSEIIGFPAKYMVRFDFEELRSDGRSKWNLYQAKGKIADQERWTLSSSSGLGGSAFDEVFEFEIPWSDLGLAPRYSTRIKVVTADTSTGVDHEMAPPAPAAMILPELEEWVTLLDLADAVGDETGDGDYVYPTASDFAPGAGLFDITNLKIEQSDWNARFTITMAEITNYWSLSNGFSHQIVQIYVDQGITDSERTAMLVGANAEVHPDWAWEVAISGTGEPGAVLAVQADTGSTSARGIEVEADKDANTIIFTISKDVIGDDIGSYRYIVVIGSQDGFGTGKWRDVDETAKTWALGGGADPAADDGIDYDPNIIDVVMEGDNQTAILSGYDVEAHKFAQLTGIEMPEVAQQIYGAKILAITDSSAFFEWSTTGETDSIIKCNGFTYDNDNLALKHTIQVIDLDSDSQYTCTLWTDEGITFDLTFNTSNQADTTSPQILNFRVELNDDGIATLSWFTDEDTFGYIMKDGEKVHSESGLAKNHKISNVDLCVGQHNLEIIATDPSLNKNQLEQSFSIDTEGKKCSYDITKITEETVSSPLDSTTIQIVVLFVILLVIGALFRSRRDSFQ